MVTEKKRNFWLRLAGFAVILAAIIIHYAFSPWGYYWKVEPHEQALRDGMVSRAENWLGVNEADGSHRKILDKYNSQDPLPVGYVIQEADSWCAAFVTTVAMEEGLTDIIPPECGCQRQIDLWKALGRWEENDKTIPLPGDIIYYDWEEKNYFADSAGWSDHVGIVVGTKWPFIKVIEGNKDDAVCYRYILMNDVHIRGFGLPDYAKLP